MKKTRQTLKLLGLLLALALLAGALALAVYLYAKQPQRSGTQVLDGLRAEVSVQYDGRGVPHIQAEHEADLYRALGYVHAQDRLFQMEMVRRLAQGQLAEILGEDLLDLDKLFRTLGLGAFARTAVEQMDLTTPAGVSLLAYLDGINQYQSSHPAPLEFDLLGIPKRPFTPQDTVAVAGYLAYSFAAAFKTEPVMTYIRDRLGGPYLQVFDPGWQPLGVAAALPLDTQDWRNLNQVARVSRDALDLAAQPLFQGSNAWAIAGRRTASGKPLLAGDPHIGFSVPSVWYEAHLQSPGFELYGQFQALNPAALLGHNAHFGWSLTMFENDDIDLVAEKSRPDQPDQVWHQGKWTPLQNRTETIAVKGAPPYRLQVRSSAHGPIITDAFRESLGGTPVALSWTFLNSPNPLLEAFYALNRADTRDKARHAASLIAAPGLNIVWANAGGDIGWWAAARLPQRPPGVNPMFILDAAKGEAERPGFYHFAFNPQEENPPRGYIVSANNQPRSAVPVPGYYLLPDRVQRLDAQLRDPERLWDSAGAQAMQLDTSNGYAARILTELMPVLDAVVTDANEKAFLEPLKKWDGDYTRDSIAATLFSQFSYELARAAFADELGEAQFANLLGTPALDHALPLLAADANSPWWDNTKTAAKESRFETVRIAWASTLQHLQALYGNNLLDWTWGRTHTLTHVHPLGKNTLLSRVFNVGPFPVPGGRETPNNMSGPVGPAPWAVAYGPSTRRVVDFGDPAAAVGINPVGQSGVLLDRHYADQAERFAFGLYDRMYLRPEEVQAQRRSSLTLAPAR